MRLIEKYFPQLPENQRLQLASLDALYRDWNEKINVISRKDIANLYECHVLHSLSLAKIIRLAPGSEVLDLGTGGGFPGIPLAILFPEVRFTLIDGTGKKIKVVQEVAAALGLENVVAQHVRAEDLKGPKFDFVVSRAVAPLPDLLRWSLRFLKKEQRHVLPNGLFAWKGGNLRDEIRALPRGGYTEVFPLKAYFEEGFFEEKFIVYAQG